MSDDFGNDIITISDEDGNEYVLEHIDTVEIDDTQYMSFLPADMDEDDEEYGLLILQVAGEGDFSRIEDEELEEKVYNLFISRLFEDNDIEDEDEDEEE